MKKLVIALATISIAAMAQEYKFPGWACTDVAQFQAQLPLAPTPWQKSEVAYMIAMLQAPPADYAAARQIIDAAIDQHCPDATPAVRLVMKKKYALVTRKWTADLLAYCQANPCAYDVHIAMADNTDWGYQTVADCLLKYGYGANDVIRAVDYLNRQAIALGKDDAEVLDLLKKLNRVFSANLIKDKEVWGGVVAQIRTMMETYK